MITNRYGKPPARTIVIKAIEQGLTSKETAYLYPDYSLRALQESARRMKVSFPSNGIGRPPQYLKPNQK
jgi:hypothetical protein